MGIGKSFHWWAAGLAFLVVPALGQSSLQPGWFTDATTECKVWNAFPVSNEQVAWSGDCVDGFAEGTGVLRWILAGKPTVKKYEGPMRGGRMSGKGVLVFTNGDRYEGEFRDGERNGRGKLTWFNKNTYDGMWKAGIMEGRGTYTWPGGNSYTGDWVAGRQHGRGAFTFANGNRYEGEFRDGRINGRGRFRWVNGNTYDGEFRDEVPNGQGTYTIRDTGQSFTGRWIGGCLRQGIEVIAINQSERDCRLKT